PRLLSRRFPATSALPRLSPCRAPFVLVSPLSCLRYTDILAFGTPAFSLSARLQRASCLRHLCAFVRFPHLRALHAFVRSYAFVPSCASVHFTLRAFSRFVRFFASAFTPSCVHESSCASRLRAFHTSAFSRFVRFMLRHSRFGVHALRVLHASAFRA